MSDFNPRLEALQADSAAAEQRLAIAEAELEHQRELGELSEDDLSALYADTVRAKAAVLAAVTAETEEMTRERHRETASGEWKPGPVGLSGRIVRGYRHWRHKR